MIMKNWGIILLLLCFSAELAAQCFTIETVLADACGDPEGENEMVTLRVNQTMDINNLTMDWPSNNFLNWCPEPTKTAQLNQTIISSCGFLLEPPNGIIPAGEKLIIVTSTNMLVAANSFEGLTDTLYIIFQCAGNTNGHFSNNGNGTRTLEILYNGTCIGGQSVTYTPLDLVGGDGGAIFYDTLGNETYFNTGCNAPVLGLNPYWQAPRRICSDYPIIDLNTFLSGNATTGGTWSGDTINNNFFDPQGKLGSYTITYTVEDVSSCLGIADSTLTLIVENPAIGADTIERCDSIFQFGFWIYADTIIEVLVANPDVFRCDSLVQRFYKINTTNFSLSPSEITINSGESFTFQIGGNNFSYSFQDPSGDSCVAPCLESQLTPSEPGNYIFRITDNESACEGVYEIAVDLRFFSRLDIPTAFTPNGDGVNDVYRLYGKDIQQLTYQIYSKWGELIFEGTSFDDFWDGTFKNKALESGIFLMNVRASGKDGERFEKVQKIKLIR